jgi:hypothetical protein
VRGGLIVNAAGNSEAASGQALLVGSFGSLEAPKILPVGGFILEDVDNADTVFGEGDSLFIYFDRLTDRGGLDAPTRGDEAFVNALFTFTHPLGAQFSGEWQDASSFVITIQDASNEGITTDGVTLKNVRVTPTIASSPTAGQPIRNRGRTSAPATATSPVLQTRNAGVGTLQPPRIVSFRASDPDGGDFSYGVGDTLTVTFNGRTNRGAHSGGRDFVDSLFLMKPTVGPDYSGEWYDGSVFIIDVLQASRALSDYSGQYASSDCL